MVKFKKDQIIHPLESSFFGQYNAEGKELKMEDTEIYKKNKFGLKTLNEQGRIFKYDIDGEHLEYGTNIIADVFVKALLR